MIESGADNQPNVHVDVTEDTGGRRMRNGARISQALLLAGFRLALAGPPFRAPLPPEKIERH